MIMVTLSLGTQRFLFQKGVIGISFFSTYFEKNLTKGERIYIYCFPLLFMPILKLRNITFTDIVLSMGIFLIVILLYRVEENYRKDNY